jgi:short-subunit dehydrogenase
MKKYIVVSGVTSKVGKKVANKLLSEGYSIIGLTSNIKNASYILDQPEIELLEIDLSNQIQINTLSSSLKDKNIYGYVHAAGIILSGPVESYTNEQINKTIHINFVSFVLIVRQLLPFFKSSNCGHIIAISSLCGLVTFPLFSIYHASKFAIEGFVESIHFELNSFNIYINIIEPGGIKDGDEHTTVVVGTLKTEGYEDIMDKVHKSKWYPSFITSDYVAQNVVNCIVKPTNKLRIILGSESIKWVKERNDSFDTEDYLVLMKDRILKTHT